MTHEERMEKFGTWPSPPFTDKTSYLAWTAQWKQEYAELSRRIRDKKLARRIEQSIADRAQAKAGLSPGFHWNLPDSKKQAINAFCHELRRDYPDAVQKALGRAEQDKDWLFQLQDKARHMLYDRQRAKATSWEMAQHVKRAQAVVGSQNS